MNKNNNNSDDSAQLSNKPENYAAKLAIIAGAFTTFGGFLATVAAVLALEEVAISDYQDQQSQSIQEEKMLNMQKQIDYLTRQLNHLTKQ